MACKVIINIRFSFKWHSRRAFTIIETLIAAVILAVLIAILSPIFSHSLVRRPTHTQVEIAQISYAIEKYYSVYGRYPVPTNVEIAALASKKDITYGGPALNALSGQETAIPLNADIMAILLDLTNYPSGNPTVNNTHNLNPQNLVFLSARFNNSTNAPGLGPDLIFRDPWGHPYIISLDLNGDKRCQDAFYKISLVSRKSGAQGFNGLVNRFDITGTNDSFEYDGGIMVWSFGPDGKADKSKPATKAPNKDNVLSWY